MVISKYASQIWLSIDFYHSPISVCFENMIQLFLNFEQIYQKWFPISIFYTHVFSSVKHSQLAWISPILLINKKYKTNQK